MALALVRLQKKRAGRVYKFLDYISYDIAKINDIEIQGQEHNSSEWSKVEILRIFK